MPDERARWEKWLELKRVLDSLGESDVTTRLADAVPDWDNTCMHRSCPQCHGTGWKKGDGTMCVHMISCPCPRCSPQCKV